MPSEASHVLIASGSSGRGQALRKVINELGLEGEVFDDVERVLYHTRGGAPEAIVLEHALATRVPENFDLVSVLRRRQHLSDVPFIYLGPGDAETQTRVINSGADVYIPLPTQPGVVRAYLERMLLRRRAERAMREALDKMRRFEQAFKESERMKDDLIHMLVHDLKSPISSVMGLLDHSLEMMRGGGDNGVEELLGLARSESQHLLNLAANILDVRRMKEGQMPFDPGVIESLTDLAKESLGDVSGGPRDRNFGFLVRPEAERVYGDQKLLRRVLANLMANAIKHTRRGGYIDFRAWRQDDGFVLSVRDDGEGIPEADQKRIFNAFEQSRHTVHDRYDSGMGLTFCKLAVEKHGGKIWVESKPGRGSTFYFTLPDQVTAELTPDEIGVGRP
ncbi:MAG TPA: hybrid sensor histidine kinase/response regulator [Trueperaceae bacterium]|nr:hybrid sensor histidine kinase/response regulator [Trueperaceae bacterium]